MPAAFDPIATGYDSDFTDSPTGRGQRERVYHQLRGRLSANSYVLELNCGTGADAIWLAQQGHRVLATDIAPQMVAQAAAKVELAGLAAQVETTTLAAEQLVEWPIAHPPFDLVFSDFAGLNCVAPTDWPALADSLARHTTPSGQLALVLLGRFCWWETLYFLLKGQWSQAWRRRRSGPVRAPLGGGQFVDIWYYAPQAIAAYCAPHFQLQAVYPIGLALPPSYLDGWFRRWPRLLYGLRWLEDRLGNWQTGAKIADHYLVVLQKTIT